MLGTTIGLTVLATDPEVEHNITYFTEATDIGSRFFSVGQTTGMITLSQEVDYDVPASHMDFTFRVCLFVLATSIS